MSSKSRSWLPFGIGNRKSRERLPSANEVPLDPADHRSADLDRDVVIGAVAFLAPVEGATGVGMEMQR